MIESNFIGRNQDIILPTKQAEQEVTIAKPRQKRHDVIFLLLFLGCLLLFISLFSYSPDDAAWSVEGNAPVANLAGQAGAWLSDLLFHLLGFLAYAFPALVLAKIWLLLRRRSPANDLPWWLRGFGLLLTLVSLSGLAAMSIWPADHLPAGPGGMAGNLILSWLVPFLGFAGSALTLTVMLALSLVLFLDFSWLHFFERLGTAILKMGRLFRNRARSTNGPVDTEQMMDSNGASGVQPMHAVSATDAPLFNEPESAKKRGPLWRKKKDAVAAEPEEPVIPEHFEGLDDLPPWSADDDAPPVATSVRKPVPAKPKPATKSNPPVSSEPEAEIPIQPLEKRESAPSERARREQQGSLFKSPQPLPSIAVLDPPRTNQKPGFSPERLREMSRLIVQKLADFGVKIEVTAVAPGPVITRFEIQPAPGVKASKISNLAKDLARSMAMVSVRVVEVIPGKTSMGIEVPNEDRAVVSLSEVLQSQDYDKSKSPLTMALGHDIAGNPVITDLARMPHLLVAGTTGSGKSVGVNAMILSLLFKATPDEVRLILIDPKMLELSVYEGIPHLLTPVVTDMKEAASSLRWSVAEMERRYMLMSAMGVRNIAGYNKKVKEAMDAGSPIPDPLWNITESFDTTPPTLEPLPYIVIVIDEFADMMMIVGKKVEELIARIAQKARAAGIHMILATQRPSVDVITGLIKANIPTRIAFQVSSKIDSRTILDQGGAEQLLGHGDMLFMPPGNALPERVHGAFVDDDEVHRVVAEWKQRGEPDYIEEITQVGEDGQMPGAGGAGEDGGEQDELFDLAVAFVTESGKCSISSVQRKLRIGYNRAARLVESMEAAGVVSPPAHNGSREVLAGAAPGSNG